MDIVTLLSSLNKLGLVAFLVTLGFLIYELFLLAQSKEKKDAPQVPQFQEGVNIMPQTPVVKESVLQKISGILTKNNKLILIILGILLILFGSLTLLGSSEDKTEITNKNQILPTRIATRSLSPTQEPEPTLEAEKSLTPTEILEIPVESPTDIPVTGEVAINDTESEITVSATLSPTIIERLPITSSITNSLILFSVAGAFLFFSLLF